MYRPVCAMIHPSAFQHNWAQVRQCAPDAQAWAIVKADGYGHGLEKVAGFLPEADGFGVACMDEALRLRREGVFHPIVILEGVFHPDEWTLVVEHQLQCVVHCQTQLDGLLQWLHAHTKLTRLPEGVALWVKFDTGMSRLGFAPEQAPRLARQLKPICRHVHVMSHLSCADEPHQDSVSQDQRRQFEQAAAAFEGLRSLANSAAVQRLPQTHYDWVRPGIMLYGAGGHHQTVLQPTMTLKAAVTCLKWIPTGQAVGYGQAWVAPRPTLLAIVSIGYGDGYPRHAPSGTPVLIQGQQCPLVGRVSMDMLTVDVTALQSTVGVGDEVVLWGQGLSVDAVATECGTIGYELLCGVTARVPRVIKDSADRVFHHGF